MDDSRKFQVLIPVSLLIAVVAALLLLPGLGVVHLFDWDELNFAESAREMVLTGDFSTVQVNFEPFWEKPPLFIWMQALSMELFGVNEFAARLPNAVCGMVTLSVLFGVGLRLKGMRFGMLWMVLYASSFLPFFYFRSGIIDPWFNLFMFLSLVYMIESVDPEHAGKRWWGMLVSGLFLGLAVLTKGPVAGLIVGLTFVGYLVVSRFAVSLGLLEGLVFVGAVLGVGGVWFLLLVLSGNGQIIGEFIAYQLRLFQTKDASHGGFLLYHVVVLLVGVFPASIFALGTFRRSILDLEHDRRTTHFFRWMMVAFWVVLVLFTVVKTKIVHYSSFCYFPLTFLGAWFLEQFFEHHVVLHRWQKVLLMVFAGLYALLLGVLTYFDRLKGALLPYVTDEYTRASLQATSSWTGFEPLIGLVLLVMTIAFCVRIVHHPLPGTLGLLVVGCLVYAVLTPLVAVPQIERYSQLAALEFYKERKGEDCYIYPTTKSYAHYFYSYRLPQNNVANEAWLMRGKLDKPAYFVLKQYRGGIEEFLVKAPDARKLYEKDGYVFYVRDAAIR